MISSSTSLQVPQTGTGRESAHRDDLVQLGVWMFLATVVMLFAAFTSAYIIRRSGSDWVPIELPRLLWLNTAALVASSLALEGGRLASRKGKGSATRLGLTAAAGLGIVFLAGQISAWHTLVARGVYVPTSPHSSFFYILTATHGVHVVAGLVLLVYTVTRTWNYGVHLDRGAPARLITASATFWHFLAALWLYVFLLVSVF
ncbi:MAG: heme-copper oxidase subunit III [Acidobacteria bacterium]|nr:heme-copper oxidase subunit III [Acidobacteriota bacterium]